MDTERASFIANVEHRLARLACDVIVDPSPASVGRAVEGLAALLDTAGAADLVAGLRGAAAACAPDTVGAECQRLWRDWIAEDEARRDVEALAADPELTSMFVAEALDHLGTIEATLLRLEEAPDDRTLLNDVFRPFHTIKGNAGALGVATVQELAHTVENLLDQCRAGQHAVGSEEIDIVLRSVDLITAMLNDLSARASGQPGRLLRAERLALIGMVHRLVASEPAPPASDPWAGVLGSDGHAPEGPTPAGAAEGEAADRREASGRGHVDETRPAGGGAGAAAASPGQSNVKVDTRKLDGLVDTVGELVILQSLIYEDPALAKVADERFTRNLAQLRRITTELQRGAMSMRMVPIRQTFPKISRLVRDLSRKSGKPIELVLSGEDTELDRRVVEDINDPLMHMVRNSVDHGIEPADVRRAGGKREAGRLALSAFHQAGSIVIEIADDGGGLNTAKIRAKAEAKGLIEPGRDVSDEEIHQLIFAPGFSTADQITEISGRGVGMDVVRRNIEALRGRIEIHSTAGQGTRFAIKLPLTLAILDGLLVSVAGERFVIPTFAVRESLRPVPDQVHRVGGAPRLIQVRDELLPLVWLTDLFQVSGESVDPTRGTVVVIEEGHRRIGLVVDALVGKQEVVVKSLGAAFEGVRGVAGGAILGDGRIGLILDAHGVVTAANQESRS